MAICRVSYFNAAAELIWGLDRAEVLGGAVSRLGLKELQGDDVAAPAAARATATPPSRRGSAEIRIQRKDGSRIRAAVSLSRIEIGGQSRTVAFVRDITAEVDRRERLALLNMVADTTNRAVIVADPDLRIVYTNAAFAAMFGYSLEEAQGREATELLFGRYTDRAALANLLGRIGDEGGGEQEILAYDKNGDEIWLSGERQGVPHAAASGSSSCSRS